MSETKCALYFGAVFSTLFRVFAYIFLRVVESLSLRPRPFVMADDSRF